MKFDGFRALAHVTGHHCQLVSRNGHTFKSWPYFAKRSRGGVLILDGCSRFYDLMFRREWPYFIAFDVLQKMARICARCRSYTVIQPCGSRR